METTQQLDGEERLIHARTVMNAVQMSMDSRNPQSRAEAEAALRNWESDAAPGFLQALLDISRESEAVGEVRAQPDCEPAYAGIVQSDSTAKLEKDLFFVVCRMSDYWQLSLPRMLLAARGARPWAPGNGHEYLRQKSLMCAQPQPACC